MILTLIFLNDNRSVKMASVTKNRINMKMNISQEPLIENDPALCQNYFCMKTFRFFLQFGIPRWPPSAVTKLAQIMKFTKSQLPLNGF